MAQTLLAIAENLRSRACAPWALGFSIGRAIQQPALEIWHGEDANVTAAQQALCHRANATRWPAAVSTAPTQRGPQHEHK